MSAKKIPESEDSLDVCSSCGDRWDLCECPAGNPGFDDKEVIYFGEDTD